MRVMRGIVFVCMFALLLSSVSRAGVIGYNERFALAEDRAAVLKELIPGTEDYYCYHVLHHQLRAELKEAQGFLDAGIKKYRHTARLTELEHRQMLLGYEAHPEQTFEYVRRHLNLTFSHRQKQLRPEVGLPTVLDAERIDTQRLIEAELSREKRHVGGFEDAAFDMLLARNLTADQRRSLLQRLGRPDHSRMVELVLADLAHARSGGFGSLPIHRQLTRKQLDKVADAKPELLGDTRWVSSYLAKLRPSEDENLRDDDAAFDAYLKRLEGFVSRLPASQNSLRANVLYRRLELDRKRGVYDKARFMDYLKLPRRVGYANRKWLAHRDFAGVQADLRKDFRAVAALPPVGGDELLVRDYFAHILLDADDYTPYTAYVESEWLKRVFAETKLLAGVGDAQRWYALLDPEQVRLLRERVDIDLLPTNPSSYLVDQPVVLDVAIKHVDELLAKVYVINTEGYYRKNLEEITTGIDLDGLVANAERVVNYGQVPVLRHREQLAFPSITKPGVYVIELIGNGYSSRALIRKGRLTYTERVGAAGHVFRVYDEDGKALDTGVTLWLDGREFAQTENGEIHLPFSGKPGKGSFVLSHGGFSSLGTFEHLGESYGLALNAWLPRETLVAGKEGEVAFRPELTLNGQLVDLSLLEEPSVVLRSHDLEGMSSEKRIAEVSLKSGEVSLFTFRVPERLRQVTVTLSGKVRNLAAGKDEQLSVSTTVSANGIQAASAVSDVFLRRGTSGYVLELLGRNGEPLPDRAVQLHAKNRYVKREVPLSLKSDGAGRVWLGVLRDVEGVRVDGLEAVRHQWALSDARCSAPAVVQAAAGEELKLAVASLGGRDVADEVSLLEVRGGIMVRDCIDKVGLEPGFVVLHGLEPGDYSLLLKHEQRKVVVRVTAGVRVGSQVVGANRVLETRGGGAPLQVVKTEVEDKALVITLAHSTPQTRVHIGATYFELGPGLFGALGVPAQRGLSSARLVRPPSHYLSGRDIGDEYRYVMERRKAGIYVGNMLTRPSLLLNPWSPRETETRRDQARAGEAYADMASVTGSRSSGARGAMMQGYGGAVRDDYSSVDMLATPTDLLANLKPDASGVVRVPLEALPRGQSIQVYAVDGVHAALRRLALPGFDYPKRDLRLLRFLSPDGHFTQQKQATVVRKGETFRVADLLSASFEVIDTLGDAYRLLSALYEDDTLGEFSFILEWPQLPREKQEELYRKYACHELHLFLYQKDPEFFRDVVGPYLANKRAQTYWDHWLAATQMDAYREPWAFGELNVAERALLGRRLRGEAASLARHVSDRYDLIPLDMDAWNRRFDAALRSSGLEGRGDVEHEITRLREMAADMPGMAGKDAAFGYMRGAPKSEAMKAGVERRLGKKGEGRPEASAAPAIALMAAAESGPATDELVHIRAKRLTSDLVERKKSKAFYRKMAKTREWVESNYYRRSRGDESPTLVDVDAFWRDVAAADPKGFLSGALPEASDSLTEVLLALALLDLPFEAPEHKVSYEGGGMELVAASDLVVFHRQVAPATFADGGDRILLTQNFFAVDDRFRQVGNEQVENYVTGPFEMGRVYGCKVVLTNPESSRRKAEVIWQVPAGAIPVASGQQTRSEHLVLEPYTTVQREYAFYFPEAGSFVQYPVHVAQHAEVIGAAKPCTFEVLTEVTDIDEGSWEHISQFGSKAQVLEYLKTKNIDGIALAQIAWRMRDRAFFGEVLQLLASRHRYDPTLWSYAIHHRDVARTSEYLPHTPLATQCGMLLSSPLLKVDGVLQGRYEHKEYWPLVNARVFKLGKERKILNDAFFRQYDAYMGILCYRDELTGPDLMAVTLYMLLQDRVSEALESFGKVDPKQVREQLPYDFMRAYLAFYRENPKEAAKVAGRYRDYPIERWRKLFGEILAQCGEIAGEVGEQVVDSDSREQVQSQLALSEPRLGLSLEGRVLQLDHANIETCELRFFPTDIELLFSRRPFARDVGDEVMVIEPAHTMQVALTGERTSVAVPEALAERNMVVEAVGAGLSGRVLYYPNSFRLDLMENYGQLKVSSRTTGKPLSKVYVKVYARSSSGRVLFFKDGYTDLRGRFDYTSLNTSEIDDVERLAILVLSGEHGALVREAAPPKR